MQEKSVRDYWIEMVGVMQSTGVMPAEWIEERHMEAWNPMLKHSLNLLRALVDADKLIDRTNMPVPPQKQNWLCEWPAFFAVRLKPNPDAVFGGEKLHGVIMYETDVNAFFLVSRPATYVLDVHQLMRIEVRDAIRWIYEGMGSFYCEGQQDASALWNVDSPFYEIAGYRKQTETIATILRAISLGWVQMVVNKDTRDDGGTCECSLVDYVGVNAKAMKYMN